MARWVRSQQIMRIFKTSTTPTVNDGLTVGDIWIDTTSGAVEKLCTSVSPVTFSTLAGSANGMVGTTTNDSAAAGSVGQYISSTLAYGSATALTTATAKNITSISLTAGDWDVSGIAGFLFGGTTVVSYVSGSISTTSATMLSPQNIVEISFTASFTPSDIVNMAIQPTRISLASTTTVYLVGLAGFSISTCSAFGLISARRVR